jgi:hypothetical protein
MHIVVAEAGPVQLFRLRTFLRLFSLKGGLRHTQAEVCT